MTKNTFKWTKCISKVIFFLFWEHIWPEDWFKIQFRALKNFSRPLNAQIFKASFRAGAVLCFVCLFIFPQFSSNCYLLSLQDPQQLNWKDCKILWHQDSLIIHLTRFDMMAGIIELLLYLLSSKINVWNTKIYLFSYLIRNVFSLNTIFGGFSSVFFFSLSPKFFLYAAALLFYPVGYFLDLFLDFV